MIFTDALHFSKDDLARMMHEFIYCEAKLPAL